MGSQEKDKAKIINDEMSNLFHERLMSFRGKGTEQWLLSQDPTPILKWANIIPIIRGKLVISGTMSSNESKDEHPLGP